MGIRRIWSPVRLDPVRPRPRRLPASISAAPSNSSGHLCMVSTQRRRHWYWHARQANRFSYLSYLPASLPDSVSLKVRYPPDCPAWVWQSRVG